MDYDKSLSITEMRKRQFAHQIDMCVSTDRNAIADSYFDNYSNSNRALVSATFGGCSFLKDGRAERTAATL